MLDRVKAATAFSFLLWNCGGSSLTWGEGGEDESDGGSARESVRELNQVQWVIGWSQDSVFSALGKPLACKRRNSAGPSWSDL